MTNDTFISECPLVADEGWRLRLLAEIRLTEETIGLVKANSPTKFEKPTKWFKTFCEILTIFLRIHRDFSNNLD